MACRSIALALALAAGTLASCGRNPYAADPLFRPDIPKLAALPCDTAAVTIIGAYGTIVEPGGTARFHNGIDITTADGGAFYSCADGVITGIDLDTGDGLPGTNYRIWVKISARATLEYHFEIGGSVPEQQRRANILVSEGRRVRAGQQIANLISGGGVPHVHFMVKERGVESACPVTYFDAATARRFERLFDSPWVEKRPDRPDLCQ